jgi:hypothetical protein
VNYSNFRNIPAKVSRSAKQHLSNLAHFMRRFVLGLSIYFYQVFIPNDIQAQFPMRVTRGVGVVGTSTYPSIPNTTVNVMRPKRPSWTSSLTKANRHRLFTTRSVYPNLRHVDFYSLVFQNTSPMHAA